MKKTTVRRSRRGSGRPQRTGTPGKPAGSKKGSNFIVQGSILAVADIIVRLIGMPYRIPPANRIEGDGNGYYNAACSIYSILLVTSSYSLPMAVSKMVSARLARNQFRNSVRILYAALFYATIAGALGFTMLWFGADCFATVVIKMPFSAYALQALAPTVWTVAYLGVLGGYFQGHSAMIPTAVLQVSEQIISAIIGVVTAVVLFDIGARSNLVYGSDQYTYASGTAGSVIGTRTGAMTALLFFLLLTIGYRPTMKSRAERGRSRRAEGYRAISGALSLTIASIILSSMIYNISTVVGNSIFGSMMTDLKQGERVASDWGIRGEYHLLFNIPVAITNSLSSLLTPSLSRAVTEKNRKRVLSRVASTIRLAMIISIPSAVGLTVLAYPISNLLFPGVNSAMPTKMTMVDPAAVVFFSLSTVTSAVLQGINRVRVPIMDSAIALVVHVGISYGLLYGMKGGIYDVAYVDILFTLIVCILNGLFIERALRYRQEVLKTFLIPTVASEVMGAAAYGMYQLIFRATGTALRGRLETIVCLMPAILVAVLICFILLVELRGVDRDEIRGMLEGTKLIGAARKLHLM